MSISGIPVNAVTLVLSFILLMSVTAFACFGWDKYKARHGKWRTPEFTLLSLAFFGGALGALLGMLAFRHKTRHAKFLVLVPLMLVLQTALIACLFL